MVVLRRFRALVLMCLLIALGGVLSTRAVNAAPAGPTTASVSGNVRDYAFRPEAASSLHLRKTPIT